MNVLLVVPGERSRLVSISNGSNNLAELQKLVGGYLEKLDLGKGAACLCDEEGRLKNLTGCCTVTDIRGQARSLCGPVVFIGVSNGDFSSVPEWVVDRYGR